MKKIKDPIHGYIELDNYLVENIVDTKYFQRLRNISQLDTTRFVYPSANHSRFEHTLGVYHLGSLAFENLVDNPLFTEGLDDSTIETLKKTLQCACLLHDIGHFPFSHLGENYIEEEAIIEKLEKYDFPSDLRASGSNLHDTDPHELLSCYITLSKYGSKLRTWGVDPSEVCAYILGTSINGSSQDRWQSFVPAQLLNSQIDVDRLDYMIRDDFMSGASLVSVDAERLVNTYTVVDHSLGLSSKGLSTIENFLKGRIQIYMWVTQHHKVVYTKELMKQMIGQVVSELEKNPFTVQNIVENSINDNFVLEEIRRKAINGDNKILQKYYRRYINRDYHASCWKHIIDFEAKIESQSAKDDIFDNIDGGTGEIKEYLTNKLNLPEHGVLTGSSYVSGFTHSDLEEIYVDFGGSSKSLTEFDIYKPRESFVRPVPYVFVPEERRDEALEFLQNVSIF